MRARGKRQPVALHSPVSWITLSLLIDEPGYSEELVRRFEDGYSDILPLGSDEEVYEALDSLHSRSLIEGMQGTADATLHPAQAKPRYSATSEGVRAYREWLVGQPREESQRSRLTMLQISMLPPAAALSVIDRYEKTCLERASRASHGSEADGGLSGSTLESRLAREGERLALDAKLSWIEFARREFSALASQQPDS